MELILTAQSAPMGPSPALYFLDPALQPAMTLAGAATLFDAWGAAMVSQKVARKRLNSTSLGHYRLHWLKWAEWLNAQDKVWASATAHEVTTYLHQISPRAQARRKRDGAALGEASDVTRRRYWRLLRDVYRHAMLRGWMSANPCEDAQDIPRTEKMDSMILPPWALKRMEEGVYKDFTERKGATWQEVRNDALLLLLLNTGVKTGELSTLRMHQLLRSVSQTHKEHWVAAIDGSRPCQKRLLPLLDPHLQEIFGRWLELRATVPDKGDYVFFGQKTKVVGDLKIRFALSHKSFFLLVAAAVQRYLIHGAFEFSPAHVGAETLRNSVISRWIATGMSPNEIKERAGVKELRAIVRLDTNKSS